MRSLFILLALLTPAAAQIPHAEEALAGITVGREVDYTTTHTTTDGVLVFFRGTSREATPTNVMQATQIPDAVRLSYLSVLRITAGTGGGTSSRGSGTYLGNGLVLTNRHVVDGGRSFYITLKDGRNVSANLLRTSNTQADLAILETQNLDHILKPVPLAMRDAQQGQTIYPSGFDQGRLEWHTIWPARVYKFYQSGDYAAIGSGARRGSISGNSGGPVFNARGELISPLWGTNGSTQLGNGDTMAVCFRSTRWFLLPWRQRIMNALAGGWNRRPIIIQIAPGQQWQQPPQIQPQQLPPVQQPRGYRFEGQILPLASSTDSTQCGPGYSQYGQQYCPPSYGSGQPSYGSPSRPVIPGTVPGTNPGGEIPSYQPPAEPPELKLDYDALAEALLPKLAKDDRFKGQDGKPGPAGPKGDPGQRGTPGTVTQSQLTAMSAALLSQMAGDSRFKGEPGEITAEQIAELTEEIKRGLNRRILVVDGKSKQVLDDETYAFDEPFVFDLTKLSRKANTQ